MSILRAVVRQVRSKQTAVLNKGKIFGFVLVSCSVLSIGCYDFEFELCRESENKNINFEQYTQCSLDSCLITDCDHLLRATHLRCLLLCGFRVLDEIESTWTVLWNCRCTSNNLKQCVIVRSRYGHTHNGDASVWTQVSIISAATH